MPEIINRAVDTAKNKVKEYELLAGKHFVIDESGNELVYRAGERVPLTRGAYEAFKDKFREVVEKEEPVKAEPVKITTTSSQGTQSSTPSTTSTTTTVSR